MHVHRLTSQFLISNNRTQREDGGADRVQEGAAVAGSRRGRARGAGHAPGRRPAPGKAAHVPGLSR